MNSFVKGFNALFTSQLPIVSEVQVKSDAYFSNDARIISSLDKVNNLNILELGSGNHNLLDKLYEQGAHVYRVDKDKDFINKSQRKPYKKNIYKGSIFDIPALMPNKKFDVIILKSVIHNLYYLNNDWDSVERFLELIPSFLYDGGTLIIRDGIQPSNGDIAVTMKLSEEWNDLAIKYFEDQPFGAKFDMMLTADNTWNGSYKAISAMMHSLNLRENSGEKENSHCPLPILTTFYNLLKDSGFEVKSESYFTDEYLSRLGFNSNMCIKTLDGNLLSPPSREIIIISELVS